MPKDTRVKPASASSCRDSGVTESGFASVVTSAPGSRPQAAMAAVRMRARSSAGSSVGVPPPKKTVLSGRAGRPLFFRTAAANSTSATAVPA